MRDIIMLGDPHIGSTVGLCPPIVNLDDGGTYHSSKAQKWLWGAWEAFLGRCSKLSNPIIIFNGDLGEGDYKNRSYQVVTRNKANIKRMVVDVLEPLARMGDCYFTRGTPAHVGKSGCLEEEIAEDLEGIPSSNNVHSHWSLLLKVEGVRLDIAHHCSMGGLPWTKGSSAPRLAARTVFSYAENGVTPPDLVVRSHVHRWGDSYDAYRTRAIILPAWTLATEFINRIAPNELAEIGSAIVHIDGKQYELEKFKVTPEARKWVKA